MIQSRRDLFRFAAGATTAALPWPLMGLDSYSLNQSEGSKAGDRVIRLYSNENPYGPSPQVADAIRSAVLSSNRYPRLEYHSLIERIAAAHQITSDRVLLGCGSTEILRMAASAFLSPDKQVIHASPT